jgi:hypothetical protein
MAGSRGLRRWHSLRPDARLILWNRGPAGADMTV